MSTLENGVMGSKFIYHKAELYKMKSRYLNLIKVVFYQNYADEFEIYLFLPTLCQAYQIFRVMQGVRVKSNSIFY